MEPVDFHIYSHGLLYASVCTSLSDEEATERLNCEHPTGIASRWTLANEPFSGGESNPTRCFERKGNRHILFSC